MAPSESSGSSFTSSSLGRAPTYTRSLTSPNDSTWTPTSGVSTLSTTSTSGSWEDPSIRPLDLGPPGYQATIILFQDTAYERTVYLGPWEVVGSEQRRVLWQCSYQNELLEHYLPSDVPSDVHPHTLHSKHRQYHDPSDMERYLTFTEPHRIRYTNDEGVCIFDQYIQVRYEFTTFEGTCQFQGDLRRRDLVDYFDVDVVWTNVHSRTDSYGKVKGIAAIQRLKLWRDRYTTSHSLSVWANKTEGLYREYDVHLFEGEVRNREEREKQVKLSVAGRRGSNASEDGSHRRRSFASRMRPRTGRQSSQGSIPEGSTGTSQPTIDIRHLSIQFSSRRDYRRFLERWFLAHNSDRDFQGVPFPPHHFELPSPQMTPGQGSEFSSPEWTRVLEPVQEPGDHRGDDG
ncbi:acetate kinase [Sarocladium implicatum]|nr:acetate kinase [Sarocladium implicatum]